MDTGKIKALATGARVQLMDGVRASLERVLAPDSSESINEPSRVNELRGEAKDKEALIERVAYTWFNRLCALRLMDSRGYTPVPVVTPRAGETMPAILADARRGVFCAEFPLKPADRQHVMNLISGNIESVNPLGEAYVILLLSACDYYAKPIPALFGSDPRSTHAMRLLAPTGLLADNSILQRIIEGMDDDNCKEVEVIGWLYQFYIAERHDDIFKSFGDKKKAGPAEIAPATQLFTHNWIVQYMVENSLGRLWMLNYPDSELSKHMDYYVVPEAEHAETDFIRVDSPEDITFCDPACGSGHILVYAFDLLYEMYVEEGYRPTEIPAYILRKNLTGFEIDNRAAELASFALIIKAREVDAGFFEHAVQPSITVFHEVRIEGSELAEAGLLTANTQLIDTLAHLNEIGSLYRPNPADAILIENGAQNLRNQQGLFAANILESVGIADSFVRVLSRQYHIVVANPPYMGLRNIDPYMSRWLAEAYPNGSTDLYSAFILREETLTMRNGYWAIITTDSWMANSTCSSLRNAVLHDGNIKTAIQLKDSAYHPDTFGANFALVKHCGMKDRASLATFFLVTSLNDKAQELLEAINDYESDKRYVTAPALFSEIDGCPMTAYKATEKMLEAFAASEQTNIDNLSDFTGSQNITANNNLYLRTWWEVSASDIGVERRWIAYEKGGQFRRWYGNKELVVDWSDQARRFYSSNSTSNLLAERYWYQEGITYSDIASRENHFRYHDPDGVFDKKGPVICGLKDNVYPLLGFLNSSVAQALIDVVNPATTLQVHSVKALPIRLSILGDQRAQISNYVQNCIRIMRDDWDSFDISINFAHHPLVRPGVSLKESARITEAEWQSRFDELQYTEKTLNSVFARAYDLEDEVQVSVSKEKVSARTFDAKREVRSLISYAIGCMFGRYSLDMDGLILADKGSTVEDYLAEIPSPSFMPDEDGILPITEEEWFEDDIVTEFWRWLKAAFGEEHFDENLAYIEETLGCKLREYFIKGKKSAFYDDHCKTYSVTGSGKRPIYWMFSSPKSSFNCLVYLHRYDDRTVSKILTDYVRELRRKLEIQARSLEASDVARDRTRAAKYHDMIDELNDWERDVLYPMAQRHIKIDLDDGVRHNYKLFPGALRKVTGLS